MRQGLLWNILGCAIWDEIHSTPASPPLGMTCFIDAVSAPLEPCHPDTFFETFIDVNYRKFDANFR